MENPLEKVEAAISHGLEAVAHKTNHKIHNHLQEILYQEMTNEAMEQTLTEIIENIFLSLLKRYWYLVLLGTLGLLATQILLIKLLIPIACLDEPLPAKFSLPAKPTNH